jgi:hypothetical protein
VPKHAQAEVKAAFWAIFDDSDAESGEAAVAHARQRAHAFADTTAGALPPRSRVRGTPCPSSPPCCGFRASRGWHGVVMTPAGVRLLQDLRRQVHHPPRLEEVVDQTVTRC